MKIIRSILCTILISYPLIGAQYLSAHDTWWGRFKKSVTSFWSADNSAETPIEYQPARPVERVDRETKSAAASSAHADLELDDEVMTKGDYVVKYGLASAQSIFNGFINKIDGEFAINVLEALNKGDGLTIDDLYPYTPGIYDEYYYSREKHLQAILRVLTHKFNGINEADRQYVLNFLNCDPYEVWHKVHPATEQDKIVLTRVIKKLKKWLSDKSQSKQAILPIYTEVVKDVISLGGAAATTKMTGSDLVSPFADTIGLVVSKQVLADNYPKNKRYKLKGREVGESFLADACYAVTKFTLDEACKDAFGVTCKYPWNKHSNFFHQIVGGAVENLARHVVKALMCNYLIKPLVSSIFGDPAHKKKKIGNLAKAKIALRTMQKQRELQEELAHA